jgi:hypothetical protein
MSSPKKGEHTASFNPLFVDRFQSGEIQAEFRKINWREILLGIAIVLCIGTFLGFGGGIFMIMSGFHSLDLAQDVKTLSLYYGGDPADISECNLGGNCFDLNTTYLDGASRMFAGIKVALLMEMMFLLSIFLVMTLATTKEKKGGQKK